MQVEIINTGTELMLGRVLNTHQQWLCAELAAMGFIVSRQVAIPDEGTAIQTAVREALQRANLVITTGGLGPTSDDITRELIAELLRVDLLIDENVNAHIKDFFARRNREVPANAKRQALVPEGAIVLLNENGTAPGLVCETHLQKLRNTEMKGCLVMLPGPPRELHPMFRNQVAPLLRQKFGVKSYFCRTFKTTGLGEAFVEERIATPLEEFVRSGIELGYCARVGEVEVRLSARNVEAESDLIRAAEIVRRQLGEFVFTESNDSLEAVVVRGLIESNQTLSLAESCTGGLIANRITNVPGASSIFMAGCVTYSNEAKERLLGVSGETLARHGAVSEQTAREMAEGARRKNKTNFAIAVTGIAGPGGGTAEKPVGTVYIALATPEKTIVEKNWNSYDRETFKFVTSQQALDLLRKNLRQIPGK